MLNFSKFIDEYNPDDGVVVTRIVKTFGIYRNPEFPNEVVSSFKHEHFLEEDMEMETFEFTLHLKGEGEVWREFETVDYVG